MAFAQKDNVMKRSTDRILTTHVGSIIRPRSLLDQRAAMDRDPGARAAFEAGLKVAVADVVRMQAEAGLDIVNDGEYGKTGWANYFRERCRGFEERKEVLTPHLALGRDRERFVDAVEQNIPEIRTGVPAQVCVGPIEYAAQDEISRDLANLKAAVDSVNVVEGFLTTVAPASVSLHDLNEYYKTEEDYVYAIAEALREEYLAVYESGMILQVDDAGLANLYDEYTKDDPSIYRRWAELRIEALVHALRGIPEDRIRYHICFGSWHVPHVADAGLQDIIDLVMRVPAGAYSIEAANARHEHEWRVWEEVKLPDDKILIPGVVTHHTITVEHPRLVADRIVRFARLVGRENVIAGTDCGFAQRANFQRVHPTVMWAKFEALAEGARIASKELWP
jgi:5-methyltetrahydropteroyltriglutamate--homocysteine methyltransferase